MRSLSLILLLAACTADDPDTDGVETDTDTGETDTDTDTDDTDCDEIEVYVDGDADGFGDPETLRMACEPGEGQVDLGGDCDDDDDAINPDAAEVCGDGVDNNCDGGAPTCRLEGELSLNDVGSSLVDSETGEAFGSSVALIPDVDGDGHADLLVGRPGDDRYRPGNGWVGLYAGLGRDLSSASPVISFRRRRDNENLGRAVLGLHLGKGERTDLVLSAPRAFDGDTDDVGAVHVIYDVVPGAEIDLGRNPGVVFVGSDRRDQAGRSIAAPGDVDGDGTIDLAIAATELTGDKPGRVFLVNGDGGTLEDVAQTIIVGGAMHRSMGEVLAGVGDTDGDGNGEVVAGAGSRTGPTAKLWWFSNPGEGTVQAEDAQATLEGGTLVTLQQGVVSGAGDVNEDGFDDVWVGAPSIADSGDQEGAVYLFHGPLADGWSLDSADAVVNGIDVRQQLGSTVTSGDLDSDGIPDLIATSTATSGVGEIVVMYGGFTGTVDEFDARISAEEGIERLGQSLDAGRDVDGDGYLDAVFGAPGFGGDGRAELLWGRPGL